MNDVAAGDDAKAADADAPAGQSAIHSLASHLRIWPVAIIGLALDLGTKSAAFAYLKPDSKAVLIPGVLTLRPSINPGALFGIGQGLSPVFIGASVLALGFALYMFWQSSPRQRSLHVALGLILAGAFGNLYDRTMHSADAIWEKTDNVSLRGLTGRQIRITGVLINENDDQWVFGAYPNGGGKRLVIRKENSFSLDRTPIVRDFIKIEPHIGSFELWPWVFNLADSFLVVGVILLFFNLWFTKPAPKKPA